MQNMMLLPFERAAEALEVATGLKVTPEEMREAGARIVTLERMFGVREGVSRADDSLPSRFRDTPLREGASSGTVVDLDLMLDEYYAERGWDAATGHPTPDTLQRLGLGFAVTDLP
jgi:aldehyde:ferredoxin oxidoreductase